VSTVAEWVPSDVTAAVVSMLDEANRCPGCGLTEADAWHVEAELHKCVTCEDRDRKAEELRDSKQRAGWRVRFARLDPDEAVEWSAAARFTLEGAEARARARRERRLTE